MAIRDSLDKRLEAFLAQRQNLKVRLGEEELELNKARGEVADTKAAISLLQYIAQETNKVNEEQTATLATMALQETFMDQDLELLVLHDVYRGQPSTTFKLRNKIRGFEGNPLKTGGGGPGAIIGLCLMVISVIRQRNMKRVLFLDEPIIQVSRKYKEAAGALLRKICDPPPRGLGFKMLVVTHDEAIVKKANKRYEITTNEKGVASINQVDLDVEVLQ